MEEAIPGEARVTRIKSTKDDGQIPESCSPKDLPLPKGPRFIKDLEVGDKKQKLVKKGKKRAPPTGAPEKGHSEHLSKARGDHSPTPVEMLRKAKNVMSIGIKASEHPVKAALGLLKPAKC